MRPLGRAALIVAALAAGAGDAAPAIADEREAAIPFGADFAPCGDLPTIDAVDCLAARTKVWDANLNAAYKRAQAAQPNDARRKELRDVQRLWIQYRDANCRFVAGGEGSIARLQAAECVRSTTAARAFELGDVVMGEQ